MDIFGRKMTKATLENYTGKMTQVAGVQTFQMQTGKERGVTILQVKTGGGLCFWITPDKGMDIAHAELYGAALSWDSPNGMVHPSYYDANGKNWLKTASGGLLMTCGLTQVGQPGEDERGVYGLHGAVHHTPAEQVSISEEWQGDECKWLIRGIVQETSMLGHRLRMTRTITVTLGSNAIQICDEIENAGAEKVPLLLLYHFNFGFPLLNEATEIYLPPVQTHLATAGDMKEKNVHGFQQPTSGFQEEVFYHQVLEKEWAEVRLKTPHFYVGPHAHTLWTKLAWNTEQLPRLVQWKMAGQGDYVLGIEPANVWTQGRSQEKSLKILAPKEKMTTELTVRFEIEGEKND